MSKIRPNQGQRKGKPVPPVEALASDYGKSRFLAALEADPFCNKLEACDKAKIKVSDLPRLLNEDKAFREAHDEIRARYSARLEGMLAERVTRDNTLLKWALQQAMPETYGTGGGGINVNVSVNSDQLKEMSTEELEERLRKLRKS